MTPAPEVPTFDLTGRRVRQLPTAATLTLDPEPSPLLEAIRQYLERRG